MKENITYSFENAPNIVTKEELYNILWGTDEFIDDNALQVNFSQTTKTLARFGLEQRIETVRGQGYRMKGQMEYMKN